jgi:hypothetical protein
VKEETQEKRLKEKRKYQSNKDSVRYSFENIKKKPPKRKSKKREKKLHSIFIVIIKSYSIDVYKPIHSVLNC